MGESFSAEDAARLIEARTGKRVALRGVRDVSMRIVVLEQWTERRTIEIIAATPGAPFDGARDLEAELWSLDVRAPPPFGEHVELVGDRRTGAVRRCPDCDGSARRQCARCGGLASRVCNACDGRGRISRGNNAYDPCSACGADGRVACTDCAIGSHPCATCGATGATYTEQRARVQWSARKQQMPLTRPPAGLEVPDEAPIRERSYAYEGGAFRPTSVAQGEHFRASVFAGGSDELDAIHKLVRQNPAVPHERIVGQRAWVDCVALWQIDAASAGEPVTLYAVGRNRTLVGIEALRAAPGPVVAIVALGLGVIAILAGSVLR